MTYILIAVLAFMFLALCGACARLKEAEEHIEIIRKALETHLATGLDYRNNVKVAEDHNLKIIGRSFALRMPNNGGDE